MVLSILSLSKYTRNRVNVLYCILQLIERKGIIIFNVLKKINETEGFTTKYTHNKKVFKNKSSSINFPKHVNSQYVTENRWKMGLSHE